jgi:tetratricopeptide (TPR) repeat protein
LYSDRKSGWETGVAVRRRAVDILLSLFVVSAAVLGLQLSRPPNSITIDYPASDSIFPPEITPPTFLWRDKAAGVTMWGIDVDFGDGAAGLRATSSGERLPIGKIDPRCVADTNEPPRLTPQQAEAHSWKPDAATWDAIKKRSVERAATVTFTGFEGGNPTRVVSRGSVTIRTSRDPVGAPIFFRDVPLMPSETEKGVIKPLASEAVRLIAWRLRNVGEPNSRLLLDGMPTCANCHSFSLDGKTLGMDLDGPQNNKGMYALASISPSMSIRNQNVIEWSAARGRLEGKTRVGFMSQVAPDGRYVVTTVNSTALEKASSDTPGWAKEPPSIYYVANFTDYRFLQVFFPARGILAWYSRATGMLHPLPGADDPRYVQAGAVWSPDGKYLVFARALAKEPNPEGVPLARRANDPNEVQIRYDLHRIPFNEGRGGRSEPIEGASGNGLSNSFPKISPDGRWIVFVQCRNGLLMRPDSQLYIVPATGGKARRMRCNTPLMNSWHSFSPNGRWMVFSSKSRSPYTQMFLTHLDEEGNDSPAILIDNATASNRAVNIPEFVNIPPDGLRKIEVPAVESYRFADNAMALQRKGQYEASIPEWRKALKINPADPNANNSLGMALSQTGRLDEAIAQFRKALELKPAFIQAHCGLGGALAMQGKTEEAIALLYRAMKIDANYAPLHNNLGMVLMQVGRAEEAITHFRKATEIQPGFVPARNNLGGALAMRGSLKEAETQFRKAVELDPSHTLSLFNLGLVLFENGKVDAAILHWRKALEINPAYTEALNQTAWVLATHPEPSVRNGGDALKFAERAARLSARKNPAILDTLAASYAEAGRFQEAVKTGREALTLALRTNREATVKALKTRIALYEAKTPCHEEPPSLAPK